MGHPGQILRKLRTEASRGNLDIGVGGTGWLLGSFAQDPF